MPQNKQIDIKDLCLDLTNYRTTKQQDEKRAIHAMIAISPDRFWALLESILDDGYHATENIIVVRKSSAGLVVKEGNRRVAALKYALKLIRITDVPSNLLQKRMALTKEWIKSNSTVPCAIYSTSELAVVNRLVALTHGKGEKAAREAWTAVARAREDVKFLVETV